MPESLLAVVLALILVFGTAVGVLRLMGPADNQAGPPDLDGTLVRGGQEQVTVKS